MSAPSAAMRRACAMARSGSRKRPPSENESGVMLRIPITRGRPRASSPASQDGCAARLASLLEQPASIMVVALRRGPRRVKRCRRLRALPVGDLGSQLLGLLDPARDELLGRKKAHQLALLVGL